VCLCVRHLFSVRVIVAARHLAGAVSSISDQFPIEASHNELHRLGKLGNVYKKQTGAARWAVSCVGRWSVSCAKGRWMAPISPLKVKRIQVPSPIVNCFFSKENGRRLQLRRTKDGPRLRRSMKSETFLLKFSVIESDGILNFFTASMTS
jgi:hypothetical protein